MVAACSSPSGDDQAEPDVNAKRLTEVDKEGPHQGGTLTMALTGVDSLDPARANEASPGQRVVLDMLYDGLVHWDSAANALTPALATAWNVSNDGLTWTFDLTANAQFSNGRPITSADVKFSLERLAARGTAALSAVQLAGLKGYADFMARRTEGIAGLVATDPGKVVMVLDSPFSSLPELLASPAFGVVAKETFDATGAIVGYPIASGPFTLRNRTAERLEFVRAPRSRALLDGVNVMLAADTEASYAMFVNGDVQLASTSPGQVLETAVANLRSNNGGSFFYGMNVTSPALANAVLRAAIVKAIDRDAIRAKYFAQSGDRANGLIPPGLDGYRDDACGNACVFDAAAAKQMVTAALAGATAPTIHVDYYTDATGREADIAKTVAQALVAVGLPAEPRGHTFEEYDAFVASGAAELFRFGWVGTYLSPDAYLTPLFGSATIDNVFGVKDATSDQLIASARSASDPGARTATYVALEDRVLSLAIVVPIVRYRSVHAVGAGVRAVTSDAEGLFDIERIWLAK
ncbi:MAG TPA: ABC transporter substrate-binding protein [Acidimicrobiales bacterium]|nr:ABC transporter substrate-binding protein [Acidimicrobiales bacterium]